MVNMNNNGLGVKKTFKAVVYIYMKVEIASANYRLRRYLK